MTKETVEKVVIFFAGDSGDGIQLTGSQFTNTAALYGNDLSTHVGFVENRAIFFNGKDTFHTDLQAFGDSSPRYTLNIFYGEKVYG